MTRNGRWAAKVNEELRVRAIRHREPWEPWEARLVRSYRRTARELARHLGRTLHAVQNFRASHGIHA